MYQPPFPFFRIHALRRSREKTAAPAAVLFLVIWITIFLFPSCGVGLNPGEENNQIPDSFLPEPPVFSLESGRYDHDVRVTLTANLTGSSIRYTENGTNPTLESPIYTGPILVAGHGILKTIKAVTVSRAGKLSNISEKTYWIVYQTVVEIPTFNPAPGIYTSAVQVGLSSATTGAVVRYTTDGSDPGAGSPAFTDPVPVTDNKTSLTIRARAYFEGLTPSPIAEGRYSVWYDPVLPGSFTYTVQSATSVLLEWTDTAESYKVARSDDPAVAGQIVSPELSPYLTVNSLLVTDLVPGTAYYFRVMSVDFFGAAEKTTLWSGALEVILP